MSGLKSGGIILLLAIPFGLYIAWQVQGVSRADLMVAAPPSEKGLPSKEQLVATAEKTDRWASEVRTAAAVTLQFRPQSTDDVTSDAECNALARSAAVRAADLTDLEKFLSGVERPEYTGTLRRRYQDWQASKLALMRAERAIEQWFTTPLGGIDGPGGGIRGDGRVRRAGRRLHEGHALLGPHQGGGVEGASTGSRH